MRTYEIRWEPGKVAYPLPDIDTLPYKERPTVVIPRRDSLHELEGELYWLARRFPSVMIETGSTQYLSAVRRAVSTGAWARSGPDARTEFLLAGDGQWTPAVATRHLLLTRAIVNGREIIERLFPSNLAERIRDGESPGEWQSVAKNYHQNRLRIYARATGATALEDLATLQGIVDGVVLPESDSSVASSLAEQGVPVLLRGAITMPTPELRR